MRLKANLTFDVMVTGLNDLNELLGTYVKYITQEQPYTNLLTPFKELIQTPLGTTLQMVPALSM